MKRTAASILDNQIDTCAKHCDAIRGHIEHLTACLAQHEASLKELRVARAAITSTGNYPTATTGAGIVRPRYAFPDVFGVIKHMNKHREFTNSDVQDVASYLGFPMSMPVIRTYLSVFVQDKLIVKYSATLYRITAAGMIFFGLTEVDNSVTGVTVAPTQRLQNNQTRPST